MNHQDWNPVVLKKNSTSKTSTTNIQHEAGYKIKQNLHSDDPDAPKKLGTENAKKLQLARTSKKLTQKELAQKLNIKEQTIRDYELGNVVPDRTVLNRITRFLNIKLN